MAGPWKVSRGERDTPEDIACCGRQLGYAGSLSTGSRSWMLGRSPGARHQALEKMELVSTQPVILTLPFTKFGGRFFTSSKLQFLHL